MPKWVPDENKIGLPATKGELFRAVNLHMIVTAQMMNALDLLIRDDKVRAKESLVAAHNTYKQLRDYTDDLAGEVVGDE